jgi:hypothetical protein
VPKIHTVRTSRSFCKVSADFNISETAVHFFSESKNRNSYKHNSKQNNVSAGSFWDYIISLQIGTSSDSSTTLGQRNLILILTNGSIFH